MANLQSPPGKISIKVLHGKSPNSLQGGRELIENPLPPPPQRFSEKAYILLFERGAVLCSAVQCIAGHSAVQFM
jgi:hypothetical protein